MIWPGRGRPSAPRARRSAAARVDRIALRDLRPDPDALLGRTAYLRLALFESASAVAGRATDLADRETITGVARRVLEQHTAIVAMLEARGRESAVAMHPSSGEIDRYRRRLTEAGWYESVLTLHLTTGLLDDFFAAFAAGMPSPEGPEVTRLLSADIGHGDLVAILEAGIAADGRLASRLALWGRRLVGDTLLMARGALADARDEHGEPTTTDERRVEPVLGDLIAAHTRRMDRLKLTA